MYLWSYIVSLALCKKVKITVNEPNFPTNQRVNNLQIITNERGRLESSHLGRNATPLPLGITQHTRRKSIAWRPKEDSLVPSKAKAKAKILEDEKDRVVFVKIPEYSVIWNSIFR